MLKILAFCLGYFLHFSGSSRVPITAKTVTFSSSTRKWIAYGKCATRANRVALYLT